MPIARIKYPQKLELTQDDLKNILQYNCETGEFTWITQRQRVKSGQKAGYRRKDGYIEIEISGMRYLGHRLAWLYTHGTWPPDDIDHINGVRTDNRICNLRQATRSQNLVNIKVHKRNTSGHTGVMWNRKNKKWTAGICNIHLGSFANKEDAVAARKKAFEELYGLEWMRGETPTTHAQNGDRAISGEVI